MKINIRNNVITEFIPLSFDSITKERLEIDYVLTENNVIKFGTKENLNNRTIVIDPWVTYYGGSNNDYPKTISTDSDNNIYIGGNTYSGSNIVTNGAHNTVLSSTWAPFFAKFNQNGQRIWATYYGSSTGDIFSIKIDKSQNIIIGGETLSNNNISTSGAEKMNISGLGHEAFLAKFNGNGIRIWGTYWGGINTNAERIDDIDIDSNNNIYIVGSLSGNQDSSLSTINAFRSNPLNNDGFVAKLTPNGYKIWATYIGAANSCILSKYGELYVAGTMTGLPGSENYYTQGTHQSTGRKYIVKFNNAGGQIWGTYFGGEGAEEPFKIAIDNNDNLIIASATTSNTNIASFGAYQTNHIINNSQPTSYSNFDGLIAKFTPNGTRIWSTYYGGNVADLLNDVCVDKLNNIYVCGWTTSTSNMSSSNTYYGGFGDAIVAKFSPQGFRTWGYTYGGSSSEGFTGCAIDMNNNICLIGQTTSNNLPTNPQSHQTNIGGANDGYLILLNSDGTYTPSLSNNYINGNVEICKNTNLIITGSNPNATGIKSYLWIASFSADSNNGFSPAVGLNNQLNYQLNYPDRNLWLRRIVYADGIIDTSNAVRISIIQNGIAETNIKGDISICQGDSLIISSINNANQYRWLKNGTLLNDTFNTITTKSSGIYKLITINNNCIDTSEAVNLNTNSKPISVINHIGPTEFCSNQTKELYANNCDSCAYSWLINKNLLNVGNAKIKINQSGDYSLVTTNKWGCKDTSLNVSISMLYAPKAIMSINRDTQCYNGNNFIFKDESLKNNLNSRKWIIGNTQYSVDSLITKKFNTVGTFSVSLILVNNNLCADTLLKNVSVLPSPSIGLMYGDSVNLTTSNTYEYTINQQLGHTYLWRIQNGIIVNGQGTNNVLTRWSGNQSGKIEAVISNNLGCRDSVYKNISVGNMPFISSFTPNSGKQGDTIIINGVNLSTSNSVKFGGTRASYFKVIDPQTIYAVVDTGSSGNIQINTNYGIATIAGFNYTRNTGIKNLFNLDYKVFPNPVSNVLSIQSNKSLKASSFEITNLHGQILIKESCAIDTYLFNLNIEKLMPSIYLLRIFDESHSTTVKIIKL